MIQRTLRFIEKEPILLGPLSLLCTVALAVKTAIPFDFLFLAVSGLFLCARFRMRWCAYSLLLLGITAAFKHAFIATDHLWQLGLEGSLACAFFLTAFAFEQGASLAESQESQAESRKSAIAHLEEELAKVQEASQVQQISFHEKVATLHKELEDLQADHSALLVLNEVLRKTTARHTQENETLNTRLFEIQRDKGFLKEELASLEEQIVQLKNSDAALIENRELMKQLNAVRFEKEQALLINEALDRLCAREMLRAKEADEEAASLADQLAAARREVRKIAEPLEQQVTTLRKEVETVSFQFEKANAEANQTRAHLLQLHQIQTERNFLRERLQAALEEISLLQNQKPKENPATAEQLVFVEEQLAKLSQIEPLYKQLKSQFEEKNQVLHQTRAALFKADTELQKLRMEKQALELNPVPKEVEKELEGLAAQMEVLEEENEQLQELITHLSDPDASKRKKKVKTQPNFDQEWLF